MGKSNGSQTVTQRPDAGSQRYIDQMRQAGQGAAGVATGGGSFFTGPLTGSQIQDAMNPYIQGVIDPTRAEFDHLRGQAVMGADDQAQQAGAFGGSRHGVMAGARMGELDRAQASQMAGLFSQGYGQAVQLAEHQRQLQERQMQEPLFRQQQALNFMNLGMGPVGSTAVQTSDPANNPLGSAAGGAMAGSAFGPWGAAIGGGVGLLGGLFS